MLPFDETVKRLRGQAKLDRYYHGTGKLYDDAADAIEHLQKAVFRLEEESGILDELPLVDQSGRCSTCRYNGDTEFDACHICNNETDMYRPRRTRADAYFREASNEKMALCLTALVAVLPFEGLNSYEKWLEWLTTEIGEDDGK